MIYVILITMLFAVGVSLAAASTYATEKRTGYFNNYYPTVILAGMAWMVLIALALIHWL